MTDPGLMQALDYILNQSNASTIDVLAEAVIRRRRNISLFNAVGDIPDPQRMAEQLAEKINTGIGSGIEGMKQSVREMIIRIIKEHAPELNPHQIDELCEAWLPSNGGKTEQLPSDVLLSMIEQFIAFSNGTMRKSVDSDLRKEMGEWPARYWKAFPPVIRQIITDYLKEKISDKDFKSRIVLALK